MVYNNSGNRNSDRRNFNRRDFGNPNGSRQMYKTICDGCGRECEVPFKPSGNKPVYCSECFEKNRDKSGSRRFEERSFRKPRFENKDNRQDRFTNRDVRSSVNNDQYNTLNIKLDKILAVLTSSSKEFVKEVEKNQDLILAPKKQILVVEKKKKTSKKANRPSKV